jgi:hypothetical protein
MKTAYLVSDAVRGRLTAGKEAGLGKLTDAYKLVTGAYDFVHQMIRLFYNPHAVSWAEVGSEADIHKVHQSAMAAGHFMLSGDFFESQQRYNEFFRLLSDPTQFKRYKNLVIDRPGLSDTSCHQSREIAFPMAS